jgi:hypothetical protein
VNKHKAKKAQMKALTQLTALVPQNVPLRNSYDRYVGTSRASYFELHNYRHRDRNFLPTNLDMLVFGGDGLSDPPISLKSVEQMSDVVDRVAAIDALLAHSDVTPIVTRRT